MRNPQLSHTVYEKGRLRVDFEAWETSIDGQPAHFRRREFQLLRILVEQPNRVVSRTQILAQIWPETRVRAQTLDVHIWRLRHYLERDPAHPEILVTIRGIGWMFNERALDESA